MTQALMMTHSAMCTQHESYSHSEHGWVKRTEQSEQLWHHWEEITWFGEQLCRKHLPEDPTRSPLSAECMHSDRESKAVGAEGLSPPTLHWLVSRQMKHKRHMTSPKMAAEMNPNEQCIPDWMTFIGERETDTREGSQLASCGTARRPQRAAQTADGSINPQHTVKQYGLRTNYHTDPWQTAMKYACHAK